MEEQVLPNIPRNSFMLWTTLHITAVKVNHILWRVGQREYGRMAQTDKVVNPQKCLKKICKIVKSHLPIHPEYVVD